MVQLESLHLEHLPPGYDIHIGFYQDVKNASFLHQQLLAGNTDFEYALVDASVVSTISSREGYSPEYHSAPSKSHLMTNP